PGIGDAEIFQGPLQRSVLTARSVQRNPYTIHPNQIGHQALARIKRMRIDAATRQRLEHGVTGKERDLTLAGVSAEQHGHPAEFVRALRTSQGVRVVGEAHQAATPITRTSGCRCTPCSRSTVSWTCRMSRSRSAAVALP